MKKIIIAILLYFMLLYSQIQWNAVPSVTPNSDKKIMTLSSASDSAQVVTYGNLIEYAKNNIDTLKFSVSSFIENSETDTIKITSPVTRIYGDLSISGDLMSNNHTGVYGELTLSDTTHIPTANKFMGIRGTFKNDPFENFTLGTNAILYQDTDTDSTCMEVRWSASFSVNTNSALVHIGVSVNSRVLSVLDNTAIMGTLCKTADEKYNLSGCYVTKLGYLSPVQLQITSDGDDDIITMYHFTTTIKEFFQR